MNRWTANRLGLVNFWYYDEEVFDLCDGKLLLRGSNGSGKSVTMQSFVPLLLDGNRAPERLDPFGTRSRKLENYLLDEETDEKTAYLYMEFKRQETEHYLTIGMGMKAVKNKPLQTWYFLITDGRRIGEELLLYRDAGEKLPLTKKQLQNLIGEGGIYTESQKEYMQKVNEFLFGFENLDGYEELLSLLINLRSPKLSKEFKPTEIYKILTDSLKVLSEEDLRPMSESMENMDTLQSALDAYKSTLKACKNIQYHYDAYNRYCLSEKAKRAIEAHSEVTVTTKKLGEHEASLKERRLQLTKALQDKEEKEQQLMEAETQYQSLSSRAELTIKKELLELTDELEALKQTYLQKETQLEQKRENQKEYEAKLKKQKEALEVTEDEILSFIQELKETAEDFCFEEGEQLEEKNISFIKVMLQKYVEVLKAAKKAVVIFEKVKKEEEKLLEEKDDAKKNYTSNEEELAKAHQLLTEAKEDYKVAFVNWQKDVKHFEISEERRQEIFKKVDKTEKLEQILDIKNLLGEAYADRRGDYLSQKEVIKTEIKKKNLLILEAEEEIRALKEAKDIEPTRSEGVLKNRQRLKEKGIPFVPLYKAIDFNKGVDEKTQRRMEGALYSMGLIDALIVDEKHRVACFDFGEGEHDRYIFAESNMMKYNLTQYLHAVKEDLEGVSFEAADNALLGIFLDEDKLAYIDEKGIYGLGILKGKAEPAYEAKYIGVSARKKHRQTLIAEKEIWIEEINKTIEVLKNADFEQDQKLSALQKENSNLPTLEDIRMVLELCDSHERQKELLYKQMTIKEQAYFEIQKAMAEEKAKLFEITKAIKIKPAEEDLEEALETADLYKQHIGELEVSYNKKLSLQELFRTLEEHLSRVEEDLDQLYYEINQLTQRQKNAETKRKALEESLKMSDIKEIEQKINWCLTQKRELPPIIGHLNTSIGVVQEAISTKEKLIEELKTQLEEKTSLHKQLLAIFKEEYELGYIVGEPSKTIAALCKDFAAEYDTQKDKTREGYSTALFESLNRNSSELKEYNVKTIRLFMEASDIEGLEAHRALRERFDIRCRLSGKEVGFYHLSEAIQKYIEETELLISSEERRVFEEVLLNTISTKITSKIWLSKKWVDKINQLMESMDTSSSLSLSLKWIPQKAESEGQLDISELLELLERGDRCSDEDMKKLAAHFAAKVKAAIRSYEGSGEARNYHTIIKEVLDYRQWYEFKLFYMKKNERKRELTNNAFFQFSGGEKAMSMYIPLFSAVFARYEGCKKECPRIIAMDEAFAGVDENNIRDMFRLLKALDLDFIINSQILWGDYDTVDNLSICEIIREENDTTVVVIRYNWNGIQKTLL